MALITYADKATMNENSSVPTINKVRAADMNEIKSVVNANARKDIITVTRATDFTISQSDNYVTIPFDSSESMGTGLTLSGGGVVVGSGISRVKISSKICLPSSGMTAGSKNLVVRKNGNIVDRAWQYLEVRNSSMSTPVRMISVSAGDVLTLAYYGKQNDKIAGSSVFTDFTVEAVEYE